MKEIKHFGPLFVNGFRASIVSYDNGENYLLYYGRSLGEGVGTESLRAAGVSLHQYTNAMPITTPDEDGIKAIFPDAEILLPGTPENEEKARAAMGSRPGRSSKNAKNADAAPAAPVAVAAPGAFVCPAVADCSKLNNIIKLMPGLEAPLNEYGQQLATALLIGTDMPERPESGCRFSR